MNARAAWRDLWLALTVVCTSLTLASGAMLGYGLLTDPAAVASAALRLDWLTRWPIHPDMENLSTLSSPTFAFLAWQFHRAWQASLLPPPDADA